MLAEVYRRTARWYDFLDAYWERQYQTMRPLVIGELTGCILEAGVGTGRNLPFYRSGVHVTAIDLSPEMLALAKMRAPVDLEITFEQADASLLERIPNGQFDWYVATFLYCVMPDHVQKNALDQMTRVLKPSGKFRILEIKYSKAVIPFLKQKLFSPYVRRVYGADFNRDVERYIQYHPNLQVTRTTFLKADTHLLIEGEKVETKQPVEHQAPITGAHEILMTEMVASWGSKMAVSCAIVISLLQAGTMTPQFALLSFKHLISDPAGLFAAWHARQSFSSLLYTGLGTAVGFFAPSSCAQELAAIRTGIHPTETEVARVTSSNRFFAFRQAAKAAVGTMACRSIGGFVAGPAGEVAGSAVGAYLGKIF